MSTDKGIRDIIESRMNSTHPNKNKYKLLLKYIPDFDLSTPEFLVKYQILK